MLLSGLDFLQLIDKSLLTDFLGQMPFATIWASVSPQPEATLSTLAESYTYSRPFRFVSVLAARIPFIRLRHMEHLPGSISKNATRVGHS